MCCFVFQITVYDYKKMGEPYSVDFGNMFDFFVRKDQRYQLEHTLAINPDTLTFKNWVAANAQKLADAFSRQTQSAGMQQKC